MKMGPDTLLLQPAGGGRVCAQNRKPLKNENDPKLEKAIFTNAGVQRVLERVIFSVFIFLLYFLY